jgi:hypothetical protein
MRQSLLEVHLFIRLRFKRSSFLILTKCVQKKVLVMLSVSLNFVSEPCKGTSFWHFKIFYACVMIFRAVRWSHR